MPWVRIWARSRCPSGLNSEEDEYYWFDELPSEECLKDMAEEFGDGSTYAFSERGFKCGWEVVDPLPEKVRERLLREANIQKRSAERQIARLTVPPPKKPATRYKRKVRV